MKSLSTLFNCLFIIITSSVVINSYASEKEIDTIIHPWFEGNFKEDLYYLALLKLALESSKAEFGEYKLIITSKPMYQQRGLTQIKNKKGLDVIWTMTSAKRESELAAIRIPILRGLGGYRIFLIKEGEQERFSKIEKIDELKHLQAGQGSSWPDVKILRTHGFNVRTASGHETLFKMLKHDRFDYMPRALHEAWNEKKMFSGLDVETSIAIQYPAPYYFFVNKDNIKLQNRIEKGLLNAEKNGSFQQLFNTHPVTKNMLSAAKLNKRKIFSIRNPLLTDETIKMLETGLFQVNINP
jgi:hypothetical protein